MNQPFRPLGSIELVTPSRMDYIQSTETLDYYCPTVASPVLTMVASGCHQEPTFKHAATLRLERRAGNVTASSRTS